MRHKIDHTTRACRLSTGLSYLFNYLKHHFYSQAQLVRSLPPATFWTSRGLRRLSFSPTVRAFIYIAHRDQYSHCSAFCARQFSSNFANSRLPAFHSSISRTKKIPTSTSLHTVRVEPNTFDFGRGKIHLSLHRGRLEEYTRQGCRGNAPKTHLAPKSRFQRLLERAFEPCTRTPVRHKARPSVLIHTQTCRTEDLPATGIILRGVRHLLVS